eukprot:Nitzschia sp. Nitz4//scaffold342_size18221//12170//13762//NITZ4_008796-RA/size18221-snap-gene-0.26-mRNA-1//-1//CDS//3329548580//5026//frame0
MQLLSGNIVQASSSNDNTSSGTVVFPKSTKHISASESTGSVIDNIITTSEMNEQDACRDDVSGIEKAGEDISQRHEDENIGIDETGNVELMIEGTRERVSQEQQQLHVAQDCFNKGIALWSDSMFCDALPLLQQSCRLREDILGRRSPLTAKSYQWVGTILYQQDEYDHALDSFCRSYRIQKQSAEDMAETLKAQGKPMRADPCGILKNWINKCLDALLYQSLGNSGIQPVSAQTIQAHREPFWKKFHSCISHERKGDALSAMASLGEEEVKTIKSKRFTHAIESYQTALQLEYQRRNISSSTPTRPLMDAADLHFKIAHCHQALSQWGRAVLSFRQAYMIYSAFGHDTRYTEQCLLETCNALWEMGYRSSISNNYVESTMRQAMELERTGDSVLGNDDTIQALEAYTQASQLEERNPVGRSQGVLGILCFKIGKVHYKSIRCNGIKGNVEESKQQAMYHLCRALGIFEIILGRQHPYTVSTMKMIQTVCQLEPSSMVACTDPIRTP